MMYEIMYIIPSRYTDSEIDGIIERTAQLLEKHGAKIQESHNFGKMKLAYPIKKVRHGTYMLLYVEMEGEKLVELDQDFRLADEVLRHMVIKREDGIPSDKFRFRPQSYQEPIDAEGKRMTSSKPKKTAIQKQEVVPAEPISAQDIDKKIDEILDDNLNV